MVVGIFMMEVKGYNLIRHRCLISTSENELLNKFPFSI
jgi:hypothetical protein